MPKIAGLPSSLNSTVMVVCHDAGAANLVFAWLRDWTESGLLEEFKFKLLLLGPAEKIWMQNPVPLPQMVWLTELSNGLEGCQTVLTGTGWASTLEHDARQLAASLQIPSIAVIDHWVNYRQRFERQGLVVLPSQIWVSDPYAESLVKTLFKDVPVLTLPNVYLKDLIKDIPPVKQNCRNLLYVLEPLRTDWGRGQPGEFQALDYFVEHLQKIVGAKPVQITLRPHPSDPVGKYDEWIDLHSNINIQLDTQISLKEAVAQARWVVGANTFAIVVASAAGRETYSSLPPWGGHFHLTKLGIRELRVINNN